MAVATKESAKQVKGVMTTTATASILMLLYAIVAVSIIDFTGFAVAEDVICLRYFDKFFMGSIVSSSARVSIKILGKELLCSWGTGHGVRRTDFCQDETFWKAGDMPT